MPTLTLGYSPCPNDTFIFYALVNGKIPSGNLTFKVQLADVETLNRLAIESELDVAKVSLHTFGLLWDKYALLHSGGALGRGCGPLLVASEGTALEDVEKGEVAVPGIYTTAHLLLKLCLGGNITTVAMPFHQIMEAVKKGSVKAGVIIHEGRFTYQRYGLQKLLDLGKWWEEITGLPLPLGGIVAKRVLGVDIINQLEYSIRESIKYAFSHPGEPWEYIKAHAQEMDETIIKEHISLYVNSYSLSLGVEGENAIRQLFQLARQNHLLPRLPRSFFVT